MTNEAVLTIACAAQVLACGQTDHAPCADHGLSDQSHGITVGTMTAFWQRADSITACLSEELGLRQGRGRRSVRA